MAEEIYTLPSTNNSYSSVTALCLPSAGWQQGIRPVKNTECWYVGGVDLTGTSHVWKSSGGCLCHFHHLLLQQIPRWFDKLAYPGYRRMTLCCCYYTLQKSLKCQLPNPPPLSLHFNSHFPGEPGLAGVNWSKGWWRWWWDNWTTGALSRAKLQSNHHHQQTNIQFFYRPDALPVTQPTVSKHL